MYFYKFTTVDENGCDSPFEANHYRRFFDTKGDERFSKLQQCHGGDEGHARG